MMWPQRPTNVSKGLPADRQDVYPHRLIGNLSTNGRPLHRCHPTLYPYGCPDGEGPYACMLPPRTEMCLTNPDASVQIAPHIGR